MEHTMNFGALEREADWLERGADPTELRGCAFRMVDWLENWCGTAACIGGGIMVREIPDSVYFCGAEAREICGLTLEQANELFIPDIADEYGDIDAAWAARVIRKLVDTERERGPGAGVVDWEGTRGVA